MSSASSTPFASKFASKHSLTFEEKSRSILDLLTDIKTPYMNLGDADVLFHTNILREQIYNLSELLKARDPSIPQHRLTAHIALTYLGFAGSQELASRFCLEYSTRHPEDTVNLVHCPTTDKSKESHTFFLIGEIIFPSKPPRLEDYLTILSRISPKSVLVDPLLGFVSPLSGDLSKFKTYCAEKGISQVSLVTGTRQEASVLESMGQKAFFVADQISLAIQEEIGIRATSPKEAMAAYFAFLDSAQILKNQERLKETYKLENASERTELEKAFRLAAAAGEIDDLHILSFSRLNIPIDINAPGPSSGKTALHFAVIKKKFEAVKFLLGLPGINPDMTDLTGKKAVDHLVDLHRKESKEIHRLLTAAAMSFRETYGAILTEEGVAGAGAGGGSSAGATDERTEEEIAFSGP